ncbi:MAG: helix-turn-helix domain-containing protein [Mogibacterium sp.]|nr:helix-turn-helix domain-containing protein [Mogibacterium sp.]
MNTGEIVKKIRKKRGLTRKQLADKVHMSQQTVANIENGSVSPRMDTMLAIMRALDYEIVFNPKYKGGYLDER